MQFYLNGAEATLTDFAKDDLARAVVNSLFHGQELKTMTNALLNQRWDGGLILLRSRVISSDLDCGFS